MRRSTPAGLLLLSLVLVSAAAAKFTQFSNITLTAHKHGQTTGIKADVHASDPTAPGGQPKSLTKLTITFPAKTTFNLKTPLATACTLSDKQLSNQFGPSCPRKSQIGTGSAVANAAPVANSVAAKVKAYVGRSNSMILVVKPTASAFASQIIVIHASVSGSKVTIPIPQLVLGKSPGFAGVKVVLVSLKLSVPALGSGKKALITAGTCSSHRFVVKSRFVYADHSTLELKSSSGCS